ncbi:MAG: SIS domain-containing protein [Anaerolineae bacterium]|nr:SIS domain-containing protein [Anaerolineae bacterium]
METQAHPVLQKLVNKYPELAECVPAVTAAYELLKQMYEQGGKLLICGNGGSAADSEHIVGELMKAFSLPRPLPAAMRQKLITAFPDDGATLAARLQGALPAISLVSHSALFTAFANDVTADLVFAQQVYGYGKASDAVLGISTSGTSKNVIYALQVAHVLGLRTIGLTGRNGSVMSKICDVTICVPYDSTPDIQERHLPIYHALCIMLEEAFFS